MQPGEGKYTLFRAVHLLFLFLPAPLSTRFSSFSCPSASAFCGDHFAKVRINEASINFASPCRKTRPSWLSAKLHRVLERPGSFVLPSSSDIKLFRRGWTLQKGSVSFHLHSAGKKGRTWGRRGDYETRGVRGTKKHIDAHRRTRLRDCVEAAAARSVSKRRPTPARVMRY